MTHPCEIGLICPYRGYDEDGMICTYPKPIKECEDGEECMYVWDVIDCKVVAYPSLLSDFLTLKDSIERGTCPTESRIQSEEAVQEFKEHREEGNRRINRRTEAVLYKRGIVEDVCQNCGILEGDAETILDYLREEISHVRLEGDGQ